MQRVLYIEHSMELACVPVHLTHIQKCKHRQKAFAKAYDHSLLLSNEITRYSSSIGRTSVFLILSFLIPLSSLSKIPRNEKLHSAFDTQFIYYLKQKEPTNVGFISSPFVENINVPLQPYISYALRK